MEHQKQLATLTEGEVARIFKCTNAALRRMRREKRGPLAARFCAKDYADRCVFVRIALKLIQPAQIKFHLPFKLRFKLAEF